MHILTELAMTDYY